MPHRDDVKAFIEQAGGKVDGGAMLPDGSGFMTASFPLPADHWITHRGDDGFSLPPPMPFRLGADDPRRHEWLEKIRAAAQYAARASTMNGRDMDFDPDALVQNMVVGMIGYNTPDGLSADEWANPKPIPPKMA